MLLPNPRSLLAIVSVACVQGAHSTSSDDLATTQQADSAVDTDQGSDSADSADSADTGAAVGTHTLRFSLERGSGECDGLTLTLTRVVYLGVYFDYQDTIASTSFDASCIAELSTAAVTPTDLTPISDKLGELTWALMLPTISEQTGATLSIAAADSPAHTDGDHPSLEGGWTYVGISDALIAYVEGEGSVVADSLGLGAGWAAVGRTPGEGALFMLEEGELVRTLGSTITLAVTDNLAIDATSLILSGETDRDSLDGYGLLPGLWLTGGEPASMGSLLERKDDRWSLTVSGPPPVDHYLPADTVDVETVLDTCCRSDVPVAVEVPTLYTEDSAQPGEDIDGAACRDIEQLVLVHYPEPTHLWAAEWYHLSEEKPGWRARYEHDEVSWKTLSEEDSDRLNFHQRCHPSHTFSDVL